MSENKQYYECYWEKGIDVSNGDVTTQVRKRKFLNTLATHLKAGDKVLDLGCGGGQFTRAISESGYEASGTDISERALDLARKQFPGGHFFLLNPEGTIPSPWTRFFFRTQARQWKYLTRRQLINFFRNLTLNINLI